MLFLPLLLCFRIRAVALDTYFYSEGISGCWRTWKIYLVWKIRIFASLHLQLEHWSPRREADTRFKPKGTILWFQRLRPFGFFIHALCHLIIPIRPFRCIHLCSDFLWYNCSSHHTFDGSGTWDSGYPVFRLDTEKDSTWKDPPLATSDTRTFSLVKWSIREILFYQQST